MQKIGDVKGTCFRCGWWGTVDEAEPAIDDEGNFGCPQCKSVVKFGAPNKACTGRFAAWAREILSLCGLRR
jgi:hypothetical protein